MSALRPALMTASLVALVSTLVGLGMAGVGAASDPVPPDQGQIPSTVSASGYEVLSVSDGDSFTVRDARGARQRIRIAGIDAPESAQPFGDTARTHLIELLNRSPLRIEPIKTDPFERIVANVHADEVDVGLAMVEAGLAWHFKRYAKDQTQAQRARYAAAERRARRARTGLWSSDDPTPPWAYRAGQARTAAGRSP